MDYAARQILGNDVSIDTMIVSHGDEDHIQGLIPVLKHDRIKVRKIFYNGIAVFKSGFNTPLGDVDAQDRLTTLHDTTADLADLDLGKTFAEWIQAFNESGASYHAVSSDVLPLSPSKFL